MQEKIKINYPMFLNVGNLCNMTCSSCLVLSPYNFLGLQDFDAHVEMYEKWAEILDLQEIVFGGGEPFLHPQLDSWVSLFIRLWPKIDLELCTNGSRLKQSKEFCRNFIQREKNILRVSVHDSNDYNELRSNLENILSICDYYTVEEKIEEVSFVVNNHVIKPVSPSGEISYHEKLSNRIIAKIAIEDKMFRPYYTKAENNTVYLEMGGNQDESHKMCPFKNVYSFQNGLIYKCPLTMNYPEAKKQNIKFDESAIEILENYKACDPYDSFEEILDFFNNLKQSIPQCSLCAYDKKEEAFSLSQIVNLDINRKKVFHLQKL